MIPRGIPIRIPPFAFRLLYHIRKTYWWITKPTTYGVKALIIHPVDSGRILLVRHSYGNQSLWSLPGGGYKPARETPEQAARRECIEELGVELKPFALVLEEHLTTSAGKLGHLKIVRLQAISDELSPNDEISEARWAGFDLADLPGTPAISKWVHTALKAHAQAPFGRRGVDMPSVDSTAPSKPSAKPAAAAMRIAWAGRRSMTCHTTRPNFHKNRKIPGKRPSG